MHEVHGILSPGTAHYAAVPGPDIPPSPEVRTSEQASGGQSAHDGTGNQLGPALLDSPTGQQTGQPVVLFLVRIHRENYMRARRALRRTCTG